MVVNLRNRGNIDAFCRLDDSEGIRGLFGNALYNVVASLPPPTLLDDDRSTEEIVDSDSGSNIDSNEEQQTSLEGVAAAAVAIRQSLLDGTSDADISERLSLSRMGHPAQPASLDGCFSTTSWRQFGIWDDIIFCGNQQQPSEGPSSGGLIGFHGNPSHSLPLGQTYSSVIVPDSCGGCTYTMLAPTRQIQSVLRLHEEMKADFLAWHRHHH